MFIFLYIRILNTELTGHSIYLSKILANIAELFLKRVQIFPSAKEKIDLIRHISKQLTVSNNGPLTWVERIPLQSSGETPPVMVKLTWG